MPPVAPGIWRSSAVSRAMSRIGRWGCATAAAGAAFRPAMPLRALPFSAAILPGVARWWLAGALLAGLVLGGAQQLRGAHFMSHTLWTGWLCWSTGWLCDL